MDGSSKHLSSDLSILSMWISLISLDIVFSTTLYVSKLFFRIYWRILEEMAQWFRL